MTALRQWLLGVACTALILAAAEGLAPDGGVKRVCRLAGSLALLLAAVGPLLQLDGGVIARAAGEYRSAARSYEERLTEKNNLLYQTIIEDTAAAYIVDKAEELGILCQAEVTFSYDENGVPCPWEVTARGVWTEEGRGALSRLLEDDLGIPPQRQRFEEELP